MRNKLRFWTISNRKKCKLNDHVDIFISYSSCLIPAQTGNRIIAMSVLYMFINIQQSWLVHHWPSMKKDVSVELLWVRPIHIMFDMKLGNMEMSIKRSRMSSYDVAWLQQIAPIEFWQNSTPFFGAALFCTSKIDNFRRLPQTEKLPPK